MKNAIIKNIGDYYKIVPNIGYRLYNVKTRTYHSEAITKNIKEFIVVGNEEIV
jgi:hypothetical protein